MYFAGSGSPPEQHLAGRLGVQADQRLAERRFAGAALADEADDLALGDRERHVVDGVDHLPAADAGNAS